MPRRLLYLDPCQSHTRRSKRLLCSDYSKPEAKYSTVHVTGAFGPLLLIVKPTRHAKPLMQADIDAQAAFALKVTSPLEDLLGDIFGRT